MVAIRPSSRRPPPPNNGSSGGAFVDPSFPDDESTVLRTTARTSRWALYVACLWPLVLYALLSSSGDGRGHEHHRRRPGVALRNKMRSLLSRFDVMGYGPTHPRVGVVIVGRGGNRDDADEGVIRAAESVFWNIDRNRLLVVCIVMDGMSDNPALTSKLNDIDSGSVGGLHWHGLSPHVHSVEEGRGSGARGGEDGRGGSEQHSHGQKVHVVYNPTKVGVSASRRDGAEFVRILAEKHEEAGLKSPEEDIILLLLREDATLTSKDWLGAATRSLILPPVYTDGEDEDDEERAEQGAADGDSVGNRGTGAGHRINVPAKKLANAVSFAVDHTAGRDGGGVDPTAIVRSDVGQTTSFDLAFRSRIGQASGADMAASNGESYPTPALPGAATALRLETFLNLPGLDVAHRTHWAADLDLSLNLWLCGDGIDVLPNEARAVIDPFLLPEHELRMTNRNAARAAVAWMDDATVEKALVAIEASGGTTVASLRRIAADAKISHSFPSGLQKKCRPFKWYADNVNMDVHVDDHDSEEERRVGMPPGLDEEGDGTGRRFPSKPLSKTNLEIVDRATPLDLSYVDVRHGNLADPHKGARDESGKFGYVHDETALRANPPPFVFKDPKKLCNSHDGNWYQLVKRPIVVDKEAHDQKDKEGKKRAKIMCVVYTIEKNHDRIPTIRETWGQKCDGFMVASTKTDPTLGTVDIPHEGPEEYKNIWQKVRSIWSYIYDNYYEKYDWFHIGGDDFYLIVENLRLYLESDEIQTAQNGGTYLPTGGETLQTPLLLGRRFAQRGNMEQIFVSGGSGYTINRAALKQVVLSYPECFPHMKSSAEDVIGSACWRRHGTLPYDTKDEDGGERYMPFGPGHHWFYKPPKDIRLDWYSLASINVKWGREHCAKKSIAFHYIKPDLMARMHALLYGYCP